MGVNPAALATYIENELHSARDTDAIQVRLSALGAKAIIAALRAASSPAPEVTVEEIIAEANNAYNEFMEDVEDYQGWDGDTHAEAMNRVGGAVAALIERHRTADRWRLYCAQKHRPATTRDGGDGHPCASTSTAPRGASAPDPSGQVDRAEADIDADVGVLVGWKLVPIEPTEKMIEAGYDALYDSLPTNKETGRDCHPNDLDRVDWDATRDKENLGHIVYEAMLAAAPTPPSPKGGNEIGKGGNEPDAPTPDALIALAGRDGGPAYPQLSVEACERDGHGDLIEPFTTAIGGMSLRDWFAGQALVSMGMWLPCRESDGRIPQTMAETLAARAAWAYQMADAMLKARALAQQEGRDG